MANNAGFGSVRQPIDPNLEENPFLSTDLQFLPVPDLPPGNAVDLAAVINRNTMESNARVHSEVESINNQLAGIRLQRRTEQAAYAAFVNCAQHFNDTIPPHLKTQEMFRAVQSLLRANELYRQQAAIVNPQLSQLEKRVPFPVQNILNQAAPQYALQTIPQFRSATSTPDLDAQFEQVSGNSHHSGNRLQTQSQQSPYFPIPSAVPGLKRKFPQGPVSGYLPQMPAPGSRAQNVSAAASSFSRRPSSNFVSGYSSQAPISGPQFPASIPSPRPPADLFTGPNPFDVSSVFTGIPSTAEPKYQSEIKAIKATLKHLEIKQPSKIRSLKEALTLLENNVDSFGEFVVKYLKGRHKYLTTRLRPAIDRAMGGLFDDENDAVRMIDILTKIIRDNVKYGEEDADGLAADILNPIAQTLWAILAILEKER